MNKVNFNVFYSRMNEHDEEGLLELTNLDYPCEFKTSAVGPMYFLHEGKGDKIPNMLAFTVELRNLVQKYFGNVEPMEEK